MNINELKEKAARLTRGMPTEYLVMGGGLFLATAFFIYSSLAGGDPNAVRADWNENDEQASASGKAGSPGFIPSRTFVAKLKRGPASNREQGSSLYIGKEDMPFDMGDSGLYKKPGEGVKKPYTKKGTLAQMEALENAKSKTAVQVEAKKDAVSSDEKEKPKKKPSLKSDMAGLGDGKRSTSGQSSGSGFMNGFKEFMGFGDKGKNDGFVQTGGKDDDKKKERELLASGRNNQLTDNAVANQNSGSAFSEAHGDGKISEDSGGRGALLGPTNYNADDTGDGMGDNGGGDAPPPGGGNNPGGGSGPGDGDHGDETPPDPDAPPADEPVETPEATPPAEGPFVGKDPVATEKVAADEAPASIIEAQEPGTMQARPMAEATSHVAAAEAYSQCDSTHKNGMACIVLYDGDKVWKMVSGACPASYYRQVRSNHPGWGDSVCLPCGSNVGTNCHFWTPTGDPFQPYMSFNPAECVSAESIETTNSPGAGDKDCDRGVKRLPDPGIDTAPAPSSCPEGEELLEKYGQSYCGVPQPEIQETPTEDGQVCQESPAGSAIITVNGQSYTGSVKAPDCGVGKLPKWGGVACWSCEAQEKPTCPNGENVEWTGYKYICASTQCTTWDTCPVKTCDVGKLQKWDGKAWGCINAPLTQCGEGKVREWGGQASGWTCKLADKPSCATGEQSKWTGYAWVCETTACSSWDTCPVKTCQYGYVQAWKGTSMGWECQYAPKPTDCMDGTLATWNGQDAGWSCKEQPKPSCSSNQTYTWTGYKWVCETTQCTTWDTCPVKTCSTGYLQKWDASKKEWGCYTTPAEKQNCPDGKINDWGGQDTGWVCKSVSKPSCSGGTLVWKGTYWKCEQNACTQATCPKQNCGTGYVNTWSGSKYDCSYVQKPSCSTGKVATWNQTYYYCKTVDKPFCNGTQTWTGSYWNCKTSSSSCTSYTTCPKPTCYGGQVPGWNGQKWICIG